MFDKFMLFLGGVSSTAGVAFQGLAMSSDAHKLTLQIIAICASAVGAGCLAVSPSIRGAASAPAQVKP